MTSAISREYAVLLALCAFSVLPLEAGAITTVSADMTPFEGPGSACGQNSSGPLVQCNLLSPDFLAGAGSTATAAFGALFAEANAGSYSSGIWQTNAAADASFESDVIFSQTGIVTGTWVVFYQEGGDELSSAPPGVVAIMGTNVPWGQVSGSGHFIVTLPFAYSGGPIAVGASDYVSANGPGSQVFSVGLQLVGFSSSYTVLPEVPEPGTWGLVGVSVLALTAVAFLRRKSRRIAKIA